MGMGSYVAVPLHAIGDNHDLAAGGGQPWSGEARLGGEALAYSFAACLATPTHSHPWRTDTLERMMKNRAPPYSLMCVLALGLVSCLDDDGESCISFGCDTRKPTQARLSMEVSEYLVDLEVRAERTFESGTLI